MNTFERLEESVARKAAAADMEATGGLDARATTDPTSLEYDQLEIPVDFTTIEYNDDPAQSVQD